MPFNPFSALGAKIFGGLSLALTLALALAMWRLDHWRDVADALADQAGKVVLALEHATGEEAHWQTAPGQIVALGEGVRQRDDAIRATNARIDQMAAEAVRLRARASELKRIADKAQAQRQAALRGLSDMAAKPGTRADCLTLLNEAEAALDLVREAGA